MTGCTEQKYGYSPLSGKLTEYAAFVSNNGEAAKRLLVLWILCGTSSRLRQVSFEPAAMVAIFGGSFGGMSIIWDRRTGFLSKLLALPISRASIVVLPFASLGGDSNGDYFADGLTEDLIDSLGTVQGLQVVARTSSFGAMKQVSARRE